MNFSINQLIHLHGSTGTTTIFDAAAYLTLAPPARVEFFTKTADAAAAPAASDPAPQASPSPLPPDPAPETSPAASASAAAASAVTTPAVASSAPLPAAKEERDLVSSAILNNKPAYREGADGHVYAVYSADPALLGQLVPDPRQRYQLLSAGQPATFFYEAPSGEKWQVHVGTDQKVQVARQLRDEEYGSLNPRDVRRAHVQIQRAAGQPPGGFGGDPFLMMLPMMYHMMMMSDPQYLQMMQMRSMMAQYAMRHALMAMMLQQQAGGRRLF